MESLTEALWLKCLALGIEWSWNQQTRELFDDLLEYRDSQLLDH